MTHVEIKKLEHSEIEITGSIPAEVFDKTRSEAIKHLGANVEMQGFRKGHVPENILITHLGEGTILEEMAEITIGKEYRNIIIENKINPISRPDVSITKMALGNPLEFKMKVVVVPEITLGDYAKVAKKVYAEKSNIEVTDTEVDETINEIRRMRTPEIVASPNLKEESDEVKKMEPVLPELDDAFVKSLGDFKDVADFKTKLTENIKLEKEHKEADKKRLDMMEKIIADATVDLPHIIIEAEQDKMMAQFRADVERMGMKFEDYIKHSKKTEEEIRKEFEKEAEKNAKFQLTLNKIAELEKIVADHDEIHKQVDVLAAQYPQADKERLHIYVESNLTNKKVFEFLERQK